MKSLPTGTVTFLFSDIEGSTTLLQSLGEDSYRAVVEQHQQIVRDTIRPRGGIDIATEGDSFFVVFPSAPEAVAAAADVQRNLAAHEWPEGADVRVRIGLHSGEGRLGGDNYVGLDVHRAARVASAGHGGQVLLTDATRGLVMGALSQDVALRDLGEHRLKDLSMPETIYQLVIPEIPSEFPALKSLDTLPNNLPVQLTSFIGRDRELDELARLLHDNRLVTLTGPGGTGKTRLSIQLAADSSEQFSGGVFFVPLATISDPDLVPPTIAEALGVPEARRGERTPLQRLSDYLKRKSVLLVLDNFEQVLDAATIVTELLKGTEEVKVVVTTRAALRVYGEVEFAVPPLALPDPHHLPGLEAMSHFEAVALFIQRAVAVRPDFQVTNENAPAVAEICARLDGLPLAIELAAARIRVLSPGALLERLGDRLKVLVGGARDLPSRQQTLRQAIAWSYDLLEPPEQTLFHRLGVFVGSFALEQAEEVCGPLGELEVLDVISSLADKSLVKPITAPEPRYLLLETIREYAAERLEETDEAEELRHRHAEVFTQQAERAEPEFIKAERADWIDRLERDHDNLRAAHTWAIECGERDIALRLIVALWRFWQMHGHLREADDRARKSLTLSGPEERTTLRAKALQAAGSIAYWLTGPMGEGPTKDLYDEALALWRELGDKAGIAGAIYDSVFGDFTVDTKTWFPRLDEALALYAESGDRHGEARTWWGIAVAHVFQGEWETAEPWLLKGLDVFEEFGDTFMQMWTEHELGIVTMELGRLDEAQRHYDAGLRMASDAKDLTGIQFILMDMSELAKREQQVVRAVKLWAAGTALRHMSGADLGSVAVEMFGYAVEKEGLSEERWNEVWEEGLSLSHEAAVEYALSEEDR